MCTQMRSRIPYIRCSGPGARTSCSPRIRNQWKKLAKAYWKVRPVRQRVLESVRCMRANEPRVQRMQVHNRSGCWLLLVNQHLLRNGRLCSHNRSCCSPSCPIAPAAGCCWQSAVWAGARTCSHNRSCCSPSCTVAPAAASRVGGTSSGRKLEHVCRCTIAPAAGCSLYPASAPERRLCSHNRSCCSPSCTVAPAAGCSKPQSLLLLVAGSQTCGRELERAGGVWRRSSCSQAVC